MASGVENPAQSLSIKVWVLKAQIHCEGCKKKIKKMLKGIPGVIDVNVDLPLNQITVKGIVDPDVLIKKLEKHGKKAQLWPQNSTSIQSKITNNDSNNSSTSESKEASESSEKASSIDTTDHKKKPIIAPKSSSETLSSTATDAESKTEAEKIPSLSKNSDKAAENSGNEKKHGKKPQKDIGEEITAAKNLDVGGYATQAMPPPAQMVYHNYPAIYMPSPVQHGYGMSYNMVQPSVSNSYYYQPQPMQMPPPLPPPPQGAYVYHQVYQPPPEYYYGQPMEGTLQSMPLATQAEYDNMFSEENPNACNLM